ncbi:hypothetical protein [Haloferula sargassicola]|uniref:Transposase IS200-like domain-containing protein n=1 Tax=Haloferula sargassicola TaxID=490096 RepID=A0ABP9UMI7_9BACT
MYLWRRLTPSQRAELLHFRQKQQRPWHRPPHFRSEEIRHYHIAAACYNHQPHIGRDPQRLDDFTDSLLTLLPEEPAAWCILPNHYHLLIRTDDLKFLLKELSRHHGRTSFRWNADDQTRGRKVWHGISDRRLRSSGHFWATLNYIHHNPVHHGYVEKWTDWPWSSAASYLTELGRENAEQIWRTHPLGHYGQKWDDPKL